MKAVLRAQLDDFETDEFGLKCEDESLAKQSFSEECDINTIVKRFGLTGQLPQGVRMPTYEDFTEVYDFQSAMNAIVQARESFDAMPANVRARFHNDAAEFVEFCNNEENREEAIRLGLVPPKAEPVVPAPIRVEVVEKQPATTAAGGAVPEPAPAKS